MGLALAKSEGFGDVGGGDVVRLGKVGNGLGDFDGLEIGTGGEIEAF